MTMPELSSLRKKDATTTRKPASGPTDRSMPPDQQRDGLAQRDEAERADQQHHEVMLNARQVAVVLGVDVGAQREHDRRPGPGRARSRPAGTAERRRELSRRWPPCAPRRECASVDSTAARIDALFGDLVAGERLDDVPPRHARSPGRRALELLGVGGGDDDGDADCRRPRAGSGRSRRGRRRRRPGWARRRRRIAARTSRARAITTFCWFPPDSADDRRLERRRLDVEPGELGADDRRPRAAGSTKRPAPELLERGERGVLAHRQRHHQALVRAGRPACTPTPCEQLAGWSSCLPST